MKQPLAIQIGANLLAATRDHARRDNRTLIDFIETALRRRIEEMIVEDAGAITATRKGYMA